MTTNAEFLAPSKAPRQRIAELDALRGLLLVLMTVTHLPTRWSVYSHDAFGFVSAAEGFVFVSAFLVARIHLPTLRARGVEFVRRALWRRAGILYSAHLSLLFLAFALAAYFPHRPALYNVLSFFVDDPALALVAAPLLIYEPPMFDILPMYAVFLALTPFALALQARRGALWMLGPSIALWVLSQFGLNQHGRLVLGLVFGGMPDHVFGAFDLLAWQLLWSLGLTFGGSEKLQELLRGPRVRRLSWGAWGVCLGFLVLRYGERLGGLSIPVPVLFDKWRLAPLRLVNLFAWIVVLGRVGPGLTQIRWTRPLHLLGRASLSVFCAHILVATAAILLVDDADTGLELWQELLVLLVGFQLLFAVALRQEAVRVVA